MGVRQGALPPETPAKGAVPLWKPRFRAARGGRRGNEKLMEMAELAYFRVIFRGIYLSARKTLRSRNAVFAALMAMT